VIKEEETEEEEGTEEGEATEEEDVVGSEEPEEDHEDLRYSCSPTDSPEFLSPVALKMP
jgi:hypothetical protein